MANQKPPDSTGLSKLRNALFVLAGVWTALLALSLAWSIGVDRAHTMAVAEKEARANFNKDLAFRKWATRHGGVYVPTDARTPPNTNLANVPERDIVTPSGRSLTLMNPAYMLRQLMQEYGEEYGIKGRITSLKLLNPANAPDSWEHMALFAFEGGTDEVSSVVRIDGQPYLRLMRPVITEAGCLKCHAQQGYKVGDVRGGVGVAVPLAPYIAMERKSLSRDWLLYGGIWLFGLIGLGASGLYGSRQIRNAAAEHQALIEVSDRLELVLSGSGDGSWDWDMQGGKLYFDRRWTGMLGYTPDEIEGSYESWKALIHPEDRESVQSALRRHLEGEAPGYEAVFRMQTRDGAWKWIQARGKVVARDASGKPLRMAGTQSDIDARKAMEQELIELAQRNQLILDSAGEGIFGLDRAGMHTFVNPAAARMLGYPAEALIGQHSHALWHHHHPDGRPYPEDECPICMVLKDGNARHAGEDWFMRKDGSFFPVEFWATPIRDGGDVAGAVVSFLGIAERKQAEEEIGKLNAELEERVRVRTAQLEDANGELTQAKEAAEAANRAKSVFLANMSHELRTPLNAILGFSDILRRGSGLDESKRQNLDIINRSGEHLLTLINDVLDMAKIESGRVQLEEVPFDLGSLVRDVTDMMQIRAQEKGLRLLIDQSSKFPRYIVGDQARLRQVLINLLGNAIKFTEQGGVTVRLGIKPDTNPRLLMEVEDSGPGIAPEDQKRIFEPFVQLGEQGVNKGTGLGLTITRQFVQLMGGSLSLESTLGKGSLFRVELPLKEAAESDIARPAAARKGEVLGLAAGQPEYRVLIVEDQRDNQLLLARLLDSVGFKYRIAENGQQGVQLFQEWQPHFIWMDRRMPVMDGLEATLQIRKLPGGKEVKIVAVTASAFQEQRAELLNAGMDDFVRKPYRASEIYDCLQKHLGVQYIHEGAAAPETETVTLTPAMLAGLPQTLREEMQAALESLENERIGAVLRKVSAHDAGLQKALLRLVDNFDYPAILNALKDCRHA
jgi:PAS domain S-box-containing protein